MPVTRTGYSFDVETLKGLWPRGDNVWIAKDPNEWCSPGGIIIPDAHQEFKRRGWCIVRGGGFTTNDGVVQRWPFKPGDYLICDRHFVRPDEKEDNLTESEDGSEVTMIIRGDEPIAWVPAELMPAPEWVKKLIDEFRECDG